MELDCRRFTGHPFEMTFHGLLRSDPQAAAEAVSAQDDGSPAAATAFGKMVVAT